MSTNILVLEDEDTIRKFVKVNLERNKFNVIEARTGEEALEKVENFKDIDISILDVMLPGIDGFQVCNKLRNDYPNMGIIMLTARTQDMDKVIGLDLGADDYVTKPFSPVELVARVNSLLRRIKINGEKKEDSIIVQGIFKMDLESKKFYKDDVEIQLTPTEFSIMKSFMENPDKALKRDQLLNEVWGIDYIGDLKVVDVNIRRLRKKIEENSSDPKYIETIWGYGYRWKRED
ncbi:response regulator transcription factor [Clostridiisalibacter paucivorans]|uniref:response regulator transcription factor n=1 Tax=Clostridiisalibacter paucivorans TaxID=408753 RepID=UPI00047DA29F|nr:response regulator transcription factor [Clostridiisalibacter paucivorans]